MLHFKCNTLKKKCHVENISRCFKFAVNIKEKKERNSKASCTMTFPTMECLAGHTELDMALKKTQNKTLVYYKFYEEIHLWFLYFKSARVLCS